MNYNCSLFSVLVPQVDEPKNQTKHYQRPGNAEQPDVDLFIGNAEPSSDFIECDDAPVEDGVYPDNAVVCQSSARLIYLAQSSNLPSSFAQMISCLDRD